MEMVKSWTLYGHPSAATSALSDALSAPISEIVDSEISAAIFAINASSGVDQKTVELWHQFDELLTPRILVVTGFNEGLQDFDDAVLLAKRLLDDVATPVLVLHDDDGTPCAARKNICIYPNGDVVKCFDHRRIPLAKQPLGNIGEQDIIEIQAELKRLTQQRDQEAADAKQQALEL